MGGNTSRETQADRNAEGEPDSVGVPQVYLPDGTIRPFSFGFVNTVRDEITRLSRTYNLRITVADSNLVICKRDGSEVIMAHNRHIEHYKDVLSSQCSYVLLTTPGSRHAHPNLEAQHNLDSLGVSAKN